MRKFAILVCICWPNNNNSNQAESK